MREYRDTCQLFLHLFGYNYSGRAVKAYVWRRWIAGIASLNSEGGRISVSCESCVSSGRETVVLKEHFGQSNIS